MQITLKFHSDLDKQIKDYDKEKGINLKLDSPKKIESIIESYIPENTWGVASIVILVNKKISSSNYEVKDGDMIELFPISGGG